MDTEELLIRSPPKRSAVYSTANLSCGDHIEAAWGGAVAYQGRVTQIAPGHELL